MKTKLLLMLSVGLLLGADAPKDGPVKEIEQAMRALNEAFTKQDPVAIGKLVTENHQAITAYYGGVQNREVQMKTLPDLKMSEYQMSDVKVTMLSKETAVMTYALTLKGTYKGKELPSKSYVSAVWVLQGGKWLEAFYQETALDSK
jgi:hypothetical protein